MSPDSNRIRPAAKRTVIDDARLNEKLRRVVAVRMAGVLSFLVGLTLLRLFVADFRSSLVQPDDVALPPIDVLVYWLVGVSVLLNLGFIVQLRRRKTPARTQALIQFGSDLLLTTALVYFSGGAASPFSSIFFVVIIPAASFLGRRVGLSVAGSAWILYATAGLAHRFAWVPGTIRGDDPLPEVAYRLIFHLIGFGLVAILASRLARELSSAERDLAVLQSVHRDIVESITSGLITFDLGGTILTANAATPTILGRPGEDFVGREVSDTGLFVETPWQQYADRGRDVRQRFEVPYEVGGEIHPIGFSLNVLTSQAGEPTGYVLIFQDLFEWRKLQDEVQLKDRMAAVGEMAAGIAHEIGNPLAALSGSAQMLQRNLVEGSSHHTLLDIILRESQRLDRTIKSFLQFSRPKERSSVRFDIAELLRNNTELLRNSDELKPGHRVHLELEQDHADIIADEDQISQIFWNLARNALRAMESAGDLYVQGRLQKDVYRVGFRDTGRGMTTNERAQIFYPFNTSFNGGTGIGMAIVYRIVEEHGGRLSVESEAGTGTWITVELPVVEPTFAAEG